MPAAGEEEKTKQSYEVLIYLDRRTNTNLTMFFLWKISRPARRFWNAICVDLARFT